jgi:hypothetical protein
LNSEGDVNVDPVTTALITALGSLSQEVIKDAYAAFKAALQDKFGVQSQLVDAVNSLEEKPESKARQAVVQEEVASSGASQDSELVGLANRLREELDRLPNSKVDIKQDIQIHGSGNIITGQGDVQINK